jgi:hypothetical protein
MRRRRSCGAVGRGEAAAAARRLSRREVPPDLCGTSAAKEAVAGWRAGKEERCRVGGPLGRRALNVVVGRSLKFW